MLPVEPKLGKMLLVGAIFNCLDPVLTIVSGLSVRDPFLTPFDKKDLAEAAKSQFSRDYSDHLALVRAYEGWKEFFSLLRDTDLVDANTTTHNAWSYDEHLIRAVICYGLYPGICSVVHNEKSFLLKTMEDGQVLLYSNSVNAREPKIPYPWLVFNEKIMLLLFGGSFSKGAIDGHLKMLGGYLEFFMKPAIAEMYQCLKGELDELIQTKLLNPRMDTHAFHELLSAVRLLLSEDQGEGRFVFGRQSQLQTLLTRAGYAAPTYKTKQLKNSQFRATVEFNGMEIMGQPCNNKKSAEKDAAAEAIQWLVSGTQMGHGYINHMSMMLKKSKKDHN
ncbi:hypothetical protein Pyn_30620 [Prunus yedoensis var. nudiflora]|uniref:RNA helicase n=1 Tax=Prunus yedoensis var. nudiflora TaxID=2094558 RepID=A0A314UC62_PRUYE|nr:hypothetical protein Pyn_30620 [Prunus yedoensis var. nudiflora]